MCQDAGFLNTFPAGSSSVVREGLCCVVEAAVCLDTDSWSVRNAVLSLLCGAPPMWMEVSRV